MNGKTGHAPSRGRIVLATVKGDVHDIGKSIVGVVLGCNGYDVIDLGVMVPVDQILDTAIEEGASLVGVSGLITPSLDEMVGVAREMERRGVALPLMIGGATTSRQHTAVKIAPEYSEPTIHVLDASRVVGVVGSSARRRAEDRVRSEEPRRAGAAASPPRREGTQAPACTRRRAGQQNAHLLERAGRHHTSLHRRTVVQPSVAELRPYIDWQFFFHAWDMKGRFPAILEQPAARELYEDANELLSYIASRDLLEPRGIYGFWPARAEGDDIVLDGVRLPMLRQQASFGDSRPNRSLADYVALPDSGLDDHVGAFAVAIHGADELATVYAAGNDDYRAITVKALADRLAEAFAEWLHERARREWYDPAERLADDDLVRERFRGIRPAFGYPACPDHSEKRTLFALLNAGRAGLALTETCAMTPAAAVSGIFIGHPSARYFSIGRVGRDQLSDYAARKDMALQEAERWLAPNLAYDPERP